MSVDLFGHWHCRKVHKEQQKECKYLKQNVV